MTEPNLWERTKEYIPKALYGISTALCISAIGPSGHIHNPYTTLNLGVAYLIAREIPKESNIHGVIEFRNVMSLFAACLAVPVVYNFIQEPGIPLGDLMFDGGLWLATLGAEIERRNLENLVDCD